MGYETYFDVICEDILELIINKINLGLLCEIYIVNEPNKVLMKSDSRIWNVLFKRFMKNDKSIKINNNKSREKIFEIYKAFQTINEYIKITSIASIINKYDILFEHLDILTDFNEKINNDELLYPTMLMSFDYVNMLAQKTLINFLEYNAIDKSMLVKLVKHIDVNFIYITKNKYAKNLNNKNFGHHNKKFTNNYNKNYNCHYYNNIDSQYIINKYINDHDKYYDDTTNVINNNTNNITNNKNRFINNCDIINIIDSDIINDIDSDIDSDTDSDSHNDVDYNSYNSYIFQHNSDQNNISNCNNNQNSNSNCNNNQNNNSNCNNTKHNNSNCNNNYQNNNCTNNQNISGSNYQNISKFIKNSTYIDHNKYKCDNNNSDNIEQINYYTPLCKTVNIEYVKILLKYGADPNILEIKKLIEKNKSNFKIESKISYPIINATFNKKLDVIELLIKYGADVNVIGNTYRHDLSGHMDVCESALQNAFNSCDFEIAKLLIENGADITKLENYEYFKNIYNKRRSKHNIENCFNDTESYSDNEDDGQNDYEDHIFIDHSLYVENKVEKNRQLKFISCYF